MQASRQGLTSRKMKIILRQKSITIALHVLIWSALLLLPYFVGSARNDYRIGDIPGMFFTISGFIHIVIFYGNAFFLCPKLLNRRHWWLYIFAGILLIIASFQLKYHILAAWFPEVLKDKAAYKFVFAPSVAVFLISLVYRKILDQRRFERKQKERQAEQLLTELKFLRSQISPHFLFNVLTNLASLARKKSDQLESSILLLSDLMRYMLYDTGGKKVALRKEVEYLNSYIALQKLRFGNDMEIQSDIALPAGNDHLLIEPMLLIPFVENAFKHGAGFPGHPLIRIRLSVNGEVMTYEVWNRFSDERASGEEEHSGIGLNNVRSRLELLYKNNYSLTIRDNNGIFHITLTLNLV